MFAGPPPGMSKCLCPLQGGTLNFFECTGRNQTRLRWALTFYSVRRRSQVRETNLLVDFITVLKGIAGSAKGRTHASISSTGAVTGCIVQNVWRVKQIEHDNMSDQAQHRK